MPPTLIKKLHTVSQLTGTLYDNNGSSYVNSSADVPSAVVTPSGDTPTSAIDITWDGNPDRWTGAERCEKDEGTVSFIDGGEYWLDFWMKPVTFPTESTGNWNYFTQLRDDGSPANPSPCPSFGVRFKPGTDDVAKVMCRRVCYDPVNGTAANGPERIYIVGDLNLGAWRHYQFGFVWSENPTTGWIEMWQDGVQVYTRTAQRTARESSNGAQLRLGFYRTPSVNGAARVKFYGYEVWADGRPTSGGGGGTPPTDTTAPVVSIIAPTLNQKITGNMPYTVDVTDDVGVASVAYQLVGPSPTTTVTTMFTETSAPWDDSDTFNPYNTAALADGVYQFRVVATDTSGNVTTVNRNVELDNVSAPANQLPVASFTYTPTSPMVGETVTFTSTSTDPDGTITSTSWDTDNDGLFDDGTGTSVTKVFSTEGTHIVRLKVVGSGAVPADDTSVTSQTINVSASPPPDGGPTDPPVDPLPYHGNRRITLKWTNAQDYDAIQVRRKLGAYPADVFDGDLVFTGLAVNGTIVESITDQAVENGINYYYSIFAQTNGLYAPTLQVEATPNIVYRIQFVRGTPVLVGA